jgi:hypothetical protein
MSAALILIEHVWAKPLLEAIERAGGRELANDWIRAEDLLTVRDEAAARDDLA